MFKKASLSFVQCGKVLLKNFVEPTASRAICTSHALQKDVALITGASGAFGRGIAVELASRGYALSLHGRDERELVITGRECQEFGVPSSDILLVQGDIRNPEDLESLTKQTEEKFGKLDVLINNAAIANPNDRLEDIDLEEFDTMFNVNLRSAFYLTKLCLPYLTQTKGTVINISSITSSMPNAQTLIYGMTKAALDYFTCAVANDVGPQGVRVCGVQPGYFPAKLKETVVPGQELATHEDLHNMIMSMQPLQRIGRVDEIAKTVAFLISEDACFITGINIMVDGGMHHPRLDTSYGNSSGSDSN